MKIERHKNSILLRIESGSSFVSNSSYFKFNLFVRDSHKFLPLKSLVRS
jgi:hypothetical protein